VIWPSGTFKEISTEDINKNEMKKGRRETADMQKHIGSPVQ
jgi:hypothetical protein